MNYIDVAVNRTGLLDYFYFWKHYRTSVLDCMNIGAFLSLSLSLSQFISLSLRARVRCVWRWLSDWCLCCVCFWRRGGAGWGRGHGVWVFAGAGAILLCFGDGGRQKASVALPTVCGRGAEAQSWHHASDMWVGWGVGGLVPHTPMPGIIARQQTTGIKLPLQSVTYRQGGSASQQNKGRHWVMGFFSLRSGARKSLCSFQCVCLQWFA